MDNDGHRMVIATTISVCILLMSRWDYSEMRWTRRGVVDLWEFEA